MTYIRRAARVAALVLALAPAAAVAAPAESISIQGSTTFNSRLITPYRKAIEQLAGHKLDVIANKSIHGIVALLEGRAQLAMISSQLDGELEQFQRRYPNLDVGRLQSFEVARTRVAFVTHPRMPVRRMTMSDLAATLRGEITSWREVGGPDLAITVVTVQPGGGVPTTVRTQLLGGQLFKAPRIVEVEAPSHVLKVTAQLEGALGLTQLGLAREAALPELQLEGRIEQELNLVTLGKPSAAVQAVIEACRAIAAKHLE
ncbi:MAG: substrate-binding domain-containing protein [Hyphomicrobiales bacterium]|nr:substrate-binding domain-containing protein [Hyphomicrobiales bacterium]